MQIDFPSWKKITPTFFSRGVFHHAFRSSIFELRHSFQLILGDTAQNRMIGIPVSVRAASGGCWGTSSGGCGPLSGRGLGGARRRSRGGANGLIDKFKLTHFNLDVALTNAKKASDANDDAVNLARLVEEN